MHRTFRSILTAAFLFACVWAAACPAALTPALAAPHPADNPAPVLASITPTRTYVGDPAFTLTVTGSNFTSQSVIRWGAVELTTQFISSASLSATVPADKLLTAGTASISVLTPNPGGGISGTQIFTIRAQNTWGQVSPAGYSPLALAFNPQDPSTMYLSTSSNLTFKINDATASWTPIGNGIYARAVAIDPSSPNTVYLAGSAIYKSINGGTSWAPINNGLGNTNIYAFKIDPLTPTTLYAGTYGSGVYRSTNAGVTWAPSNAGVGANIRCLEIDPQTPTTLYAGTDGSGAYKTTNSGANWTGISVGLSSYVYDIKIAPGDSNTLYAATNQGIYKSTNAGASWSNIYNALSVYSLAIDPTRPTILYAGTFIDLIRSTDGGATWTPLSLNSQNANFVALSPANPSLVFLLNGSGAYSQKFTNPAPVLTSLSQTDASVGDPGFTLQINGRNFVDGMQVLWDDAPLPTTFLNSGALQVELTAPQLANPAYALISVRDSSPGGGLSNTLPFNVTGASPATPLLDRMTPVTRTLGAAPFQISLYGRNFASRAQVFWQGASIPTTYISPRELRATVPDGSFINQAQIYYVWVVNPGGDSPFSGMLEFRVYPPATPTASITTLNPASTTAGSPALTLEISGQNFAEGAIVVWGTSTTITPTLLAHNRLTVPLHAGLLTAAGDTPIKVVNPSVPPSNTLTFSIVPPNPIPTLLGATPNPVLAGGADFDLTLNGLNFVNGAVAQWNGIDLVTTYVSATQLSAVVPAALAASSGTVSIRVVNPAPGGGASGARLLQIINPAPALTSLSPAEVYSGSPDLALTVYGSGFVNGAVVRTGGADLATTFVSATRLNAVVPAAALTTAGSLNITVANPAPAAGGSNTLALTINMPPPLELSAIAPTFEFIGEEGFTLTLDGAGFMEGSQVRWGGLTLPTTFVSSNRLTAQVSSAQLGAAGAVNVSVQNPLPLGDLSSAIPFTVRPTGTWYPLALADQNPSMMIADPAVAGKFYAAMYSGKFFISSDSGRTWQEHSNGLPGLPIYGLTMDPANSQVFYAAVNDGGVYKTANGGESWSALNTGLSALTARMVAVDPHNPDVLYVAVYNQGINKSTDGGAHWALSGTQPTLKPVTIAVDSSDSNILYMGDFETGMFRSADAGATWTKISQTCRSYALAASPLVSGLAAGGNTCGVLVTTDFGVSWKTTTSMPIQLLYSVAFHPQMDGTLLAGTRDGKVLHSLHLGAPGTWTVYTAGLSSSKIITALMVDPFHPGMVYAGMNGGIYILKTPYPMSYLTSISPVKRIATSGTFTLTVNGSAFSPGAVVKWGTFPLATTYINQHQLQAAVPAAYIENAGSVNISVSYAIPGSGMSNLLAFTIQPRPTVFMPLILR